MKSFTIFLIVLAWVIFGFFLLYLIPAKSDSHYQYSKPNIPVEEVIDTPGDGIKMWDDSNSKG